MWHMNAPKCSCPGCPRCYEWPSQGPGCRHTRAKSDRLLEPANMRCVGCGAHRDEAIASTQRKGAGKGQSSTGSGAAAGTARREDDAQSSTGSDSAAGTARREDDARIAELREVIRTFTEEVGALRRDLTHLRSEFLNLQARVEGWARW